MRVSVLIVTIGFIAALAVPARAQHEHYPGKGQPPVLHVSKAYRSCFFDLHPELTQSQFKEFASELGSIARFRQFADATTLGKGRMEISVEYNNTPIDDSKGAWNNTMSHPDADHWLGQSIAFPRLVARFGASDRVDIGAWGSINPESNYGMVGVDTKIALLRQGPEMPVSVAIRPSFTSLLGPSEVWVGNTSVDVSVSRAFGALSPYAGVATSSTAAIEHSKEVDLDPATGSDSLVYAGLSYRWRTLVVSAEVETGTLDSYGIRIGKQF